VALDCSIVIHHVLEINLYQVRAHILSSRPLGIFTPAMSLPCLEMTRSYSIVVALNADHGGC